MSPALGLPDLRADCAACLSLCCVIPAFDKDSGFGFDKAAFQPCPNLRSAGCGIHKSLVAKGFPACAAFDCAGAGQRTITLHKGLDWRKDPDHLATLAQTYTFLRRLHDIVEALMLCASLPLTPAERTARTQHLGRLGALDLTLEDLTGLASSDALHKAKSFLSSLRHHLTMGSDDHKD